MPSPLVMTICSQPLLRLGLRQALTEDARLKICGEATSAAEAVQMHTRLRPNVVVLVTGCALGDGLGLIKELHRARQSLPMLVVGRAGDEQHVHRVLRAGALGYITCGDGLQEVLLAVGAVHAGSLYVSHATSGGLLVKLTSRAGAATADDLGALSDREMEVFRLVGEGKSCKDIAGSLGISVKTVETHRQRMKGKLHLHSSAELNQHAVRDAQRR